MITNAIGTTVPVLEFQVKVFLLSMIQQDFAIVHDKGLELVLKLPNLHLEPEKVLDTTSHLWRDIVIMH